MSYYFLYIPNNKIKVEIWSFHFPPNHPWKDLPVVFAPCSSSSAPPGHSSLCWCSPARVEGRTAAPAAREASLLWPWPPARSSEGSLSLCSVGPSQQHESSPEHRASHWALCFLCSAGGRCRHMICMWYNNSQWRNKLISCTTCEFSVNNTKLHSTVLTCSFILCCSCIILFSMPTLSFLKCSTERASTFSFFSSLLALMRRTQLCSRTMADRVRL